MAFIKMNEHDLTVLIKSGNYDALFIPTSTTVIQRTKTLVLSSKYNGLLNGLFPEIKKQLAKFHVSHKGDNNDYDELEDSYGNVVRVYQTHAAMATMRLGKHIVPVGILPVKRHYQSKRINAQMLSNGLSSIQKYAKHYGWNKVLVLHPMYDMTVSAIETLLQTNIDDKSAIQVIQISSAKKPVPKKTVVKRDTREVVSEEKYLEEAEALGDRIGDYV